MHLVVQQTIFYTVYSFLLYSGDSATDTTKDLTTDITIDRTKDRTTDPKTDTTTDSTTDSTQTVQLSTVQSIPRTLTFVWLRLTTLPGHSVNCTALQRDTLYYPTLHCRRNTLLHCTAMH